jgi:hypothetical protein
MHSRGWPQAFREHSLAPLNISASVFGNSRKHEILFVKPRIPIIFLGSPKNNSFGRG